MADIQGDTGTRRLKESSYREQYTRQHIREGWEPKGFERYQYQRALLQQMPVVGGPDDPFLSAPDRYRMAQPCQDTLDCRCGDK